ncbi:MAG: phosphoribosylglycinamide formyltransferase [Candidatus Baltobacteraceae bacterium]
MVNLIVDLSDERFDAARTESIRSSLGARGFSLEQLANTREAALAWIDEEFGGSWSSEVFAGKSIVAQNADGFAGFSAYGACGLKYRWLAAWQDRRDVGIFGPIGVSRAHRGSPLAAGLLVLALGALRAKGYGFALIPAVGAAALIRFYETNAGAKVIEEFQPSAWMNRKLRTTVLASGSGTNFQAVLDAAEDPAANLPLELTSLVTNNSSAYALERAKRAAVRNQIVVQWERAVESRQTYDARLLHAVGQTQPELLLLLGWMHVLSEQCILAFPQMLNIHPAFLPHDQERDTVGMPDGVEIPAFRGAHAIRDAIAQGSPWVGATAHRVTLGTDRGEVLVRKPFAVAPGESADSLMDRLRPVEHRVLLGGIRRCVLERKL